VAQQPAAEQQEPAQEAVVALVALVAVVALTVLIQFTEPERQVPAAPAAVPVAVTILLNLQKLLQARKLVNYTLELLHQLHAKYPRLQKRPDNPL